jgi:hypothetical protein
MVANYAERSQRPNLAWNAPAWPWLNFDFFSSS